MVRWAVRPTLPIPGSTLVGLMPVRGLGALPTHPQKSTGSRSLSPNIALLLPFPSPPTRIRISGRTRRSCFSLYPLLRVASSVTRAITQGGIQPRMGPVMPSLQTAGNLLSSLLRL